MIRLTGDDHDGHRNNNVPAIVKGIAQTAADATREPTARDAGRSGLFIQRRTRTAAAAAAAHAIVVVVVGVVVVVIRHGTDRNRRAESVSPSVVPNQSTIDAGVAERTLTGYDGRLIRRCNRSTAGAMRSGAVRCKKTRGPPRDSCAVCTAVYGDSVVT